MSTLLHSGKKPAAKASTANPPSNNLQKSVHIYTRGQVKLDVLAARTKDMLDKIAFQWQLDVAETILCGEDIIVDVGTGNGKTLCMEMPLCLHETDIAMRVCPLTALMIDQVSTLNPVSH